MWKKFRWYKVSAWIRGYRAIDRYEYYFMEIENRLPQKSTWNREAQRDDGRDFGSFGSLGSQGWRYVGIVDNLHLFERKVHW